MEYNELENVLGRILAQNGVFVATIAYMRGSEMRTCILSTDNHPAEDFFKQVQKNTEDFIMQSGGVKNARGKIII